MLIADLRPHLTEKFVQVYDEFIPLYAHKKTEPVTAPLYGGCCGCLCLHGNNVVDFLFQRLFRHFQIVGVLQVQPALCIAAEITGEAQGGVGTDAPLFAHDVVNTRCGHMQGDRQGVGRYVERNQVLFAQNFAGVYGSHFVIHGSSLMVIDNFNIVGMSVFKTEANPPLVVDADAELSDTAAFECFKPVAGRGTQKIHGNSRIQHLQLAFRRLADSPEFQWAAALKQLLCMFAVKSLNHGYII